LAHKKPVDVSRKPEIFALLRDHAAALRYDKGEYRKLEEEIGALPEEIVSRELRTRLLLTVWDAKRQEMRRRELENRASEALEKLEAGKRREYRKVAQVMGFTRRGAPPKYPRELVVAEYLCLLRFDPFWSETLAELLEIDGLASRRLELEEAVRLLTKRWGFPNPLACRQFLVEAKKPMREQDFHLFGFGSDELSDFPVPDPAKLQS